jgi:hypothetical protein
MMFGSVDVMAHLSTHSRLPTSVLLGLLTAATAIALIATAQTAAYFDYLGKNIPWAGLLKADLTDWYLSAFFVLLLYCLALYRPIDRSSWRTVLPLYAIAVFACALAKEIAFVAIGNWFRPGVIRLPEMLARDFLDQVIFNWCAMGILSLWVLWTRSQSERKNGAKSINRLLVRGAGGYQLVPIEQIEWIHAQGNYAQLNTGGGRHLVRETMSSLEQRLGDMFVRVHRGAIVNRTCIERVEPRSHGSYAIVLSSGEEILSGRSYNRKLRSIFG